MSPKRLYLALCVVGTLLPYSQFIPFLRQHGLDFQLFFAQLFANRVSAFFGWDVIVSSTLLWALVAIEGRRARMGGGATLGADRRESDCWSLPWAAVVPLHA